MVVLRPEDIKSLIGLSDESLDCSGIKLTLKTIYVPETVGELRVDGRVLPEYEELRCDPMCRLSSGAYIVRYNEYVKIPNGYMGLVFPRSSLLRMGATIYTAVWDPGYEGQGIGLLAVFNKQGIVLEKNVQLAQLVLFKMSGETMFSYKGTYLGEKEA
ncbi:deoxyUTP pyrophosphatase [Staphylothermus marinus F1]|uniref:DeoxyUTP pyrophosphatase n=1 Tax=Staphylothermus marinus (strain ATCC 43588 / DSM 3639 / JCM 9404 / F1) TaxID=399550 RepID=A3DNT8_STAMF|nr:deoxyuridine 5'-triphosphate nucleotidohydrolase [Staphylothermus marinus]ABN70298.1 deoxyUTP pyrophosphatase [Staphylothermus marinus F1]